MKHSIKITRCASCTVLATSLAAFLVTGCCSSKHVANPKDITLKDALVSVAVGLSEMRRTSASNMPFGLCPSDVEVTFNISASRDDSGELKLDLGAPTGAPVNASLGGSLGFKSTATRGNQITVKFANVMLVDPANTLIGVKGEQAIELIKRLQKEGLVQLIKNDAAP